MPPLLCAANAMYMAGQEMEKVLERDNGTIGRHLGKVRRQIASLHFIALTLLLD